MVFVICFYIVLPETDWVIIECKLSKKNKSAIGRQKSPLKNSSDLVLSHIVGQQQTWAQNI